MRTNEPVLFNGTAASLSAAITPLLIAAGVQSDGAGRIGSFIGAAAFVLLTVWHLYSGRSKATPVANPKGIDGIPLVSILDAALEHPNANAEAPTPAPVESAPPAELPVQPS